MPTGLGHGQPVAERLEAGLQHELGLALPGGDGSDDTLVQAGGQGIGLDVGHEPVLVLRADEVLDLRGGTHGGWLPGRRLAAEFRSILLRN